MKTYIPPLPVAIEAKKGLELRSVQTESNKCCTPVGIRRAVQLSNRQPVSIDTIKRMRSYFARHSVDRLGKGWGINSKGYQAWLCWGGDAGRDWAEKIFQQNSDESIDRNDSAMIKYKTISEEDLRDYDFDPYTEAMGEGINILSHMQFSLGKVYRGKLVAALFTNINNSEYSFDIFVKEKYAGKGIGSSLVDDAVSEFRSLKSDGFDDLKLEVHVVSPAMRKILLRKGFYVKSGRSGNWIMVLPNSPRKARLDRNPPSNGYAYIGRGSFAEAYLGREGKAVELLIKKKESYVSRLPFHDSVRPDSVWSAVYDMSREAMILARENASGSIKQFLPIISRKRLDIDKDGSVEFIYEMPKYEEYHFHIDEHYIKPTASQESEISRLIELYMEVLYVDSGYDKRVIKELSSIDGKKIANLLDNNLGVLNNVKVYRDPIVCKFLEKDALRLFTPLFPNYEEVKERLKAGNKTKPTSIPLLTNPPSPGFSKLGEGYFAKAYYDEGDVELIFQPTEIDMYGELEFDLSRELLINFRDSLPDEFKKYLPEISRKRIEFSDMARRVDGQMVRLPEIVYGMPLYDKVRGNNIALAQAISRYANSGFRLSNGVQPFMLTLTRAIAQLADKTGANLDFSLENFSQRKDGTIVFRDPLTFRSDGFCDPKISDFWPKKYSDIFSKMMPEADGSVAIDRPKGALWPNANTIQQNPPRRKLHRNEYMPDEVSDNLVQQAKMLKHHMAYLKHQASIAKKSLTRNSSKNPTYEEYLFFAADENDRIVHLSSSIIDVAKYGKRIRIAQVSCSTPAMFSKASKELSRSEILSLLKKHDSIIIVSPLTVIVDDIKKVRVIPEQNEILLHRNAPFIPSELKKIAMTHAQMIPHHVRYVKGMLGK